MRAGHHGTAWAVALAAGKRAWTAAAAAAPCAQGPPQKRRRKPLPRGHAMDLWGRHRGSFDRWIWCRADAAQASSVARPLGCCAAVASFRRSVLGPAGCCAPSGALVAVHHTRFFASIDHGPMACGWQNHRHSRFAVRVVIANARLALGLLCTSGPSAMARATCPRREWVHALYVILSLFLSY